MESKFTNRVLIIDDEAMLRKSIATYLEDSGFEVAEALDGNHGLEIFKKQAPDIVLTDLRMPSISGISVLEKIKQQAPDVPVIVVSGAGVMEDAIKAIRLGAWDFITKPIADLAVLEHIVCKALERARLVKENKLYRKQLEEKNLELAQSLEILEQDQKAGINVQQRLLPNSKLKLGKLKFHHQILPSLFLSGDFVDYFQINEDNYAFYIADVSGHGVSSAFVTVLLKNFVETELNKFHAGESSTILEPKKLLQHLSKEILTVDLGKYLTIFYGIVNVKKDICTYSIGGHFPSPMYISKNKCFYIEGRGFPVGVFAKAEFKDYELPLDKNFSILLLSDGVLEVMLEKGLEAKEDKLLSLAKQSKGEINYILEKLGLDSDCKIPDDITMLQVKRD